MLPCSGDESRIGSSCTWNAACLGTGLLAVLAYGCYVAQLSFRQTSHSTSRVLRHAPARLQSMQSTSCEHVGTPTGGTSALRAAQMAAVKLTESGCRWRSPIRPSFHNPRAQPHFSALQITAHQLQARGASPNAVPSPNDDLCHRRQSLSCNCRGLAFVGPIFRAKWYPGMHQRQVAPESSLPPATRKPVVRGNEQAS